MKSKKNIRKRLKKLISLCIIIALCCTGLGEKSWDSVKGEELSEIKLKNEEQKEDGNYIEDKESTKNEESMEQINTDEFHAIWITYLEFSSNGYKEKDFKAHIDKMFDNVVTLGMNAVIVQVRPFGDAFYPSKYFPWSKYVSGTQGKNPGYDPLAYMVKAAHERGLEFHAWINPYRITSSGTDVTALAKTNQARKWLTDSKKSNDRYVLSYGGKLYYNPSVSAVRTLIVNGVREIVQNYDVDGIHFDDYFYPTLGSKYKTVFDAKEYETYKKQKIAEEKNYQSIVEWRKTQVNYLLKRVYQAIKEANEEIVFGVSPEGYIPNLIKPDRHYTDIKKWLNTEGYVDYLCPQVYFSFEHPVAAFDACVDEWISYRKSTSNVKIYVGIPIYKAGSNIEDQFKDDPFVLASMIDYCRETDEIDGYMHYRYDFFFNKTTKPAVTQLLNKIAK